MKHSERVTAEPLPFPVSFGDPPCLTFRATEQAAFSRFGKPHARFNEEEIFTEPGPCVYWAFRYSCGLEIMLTYYYYVDWIKVSANQFDVEHILVHLNMATPELWKMEMNGSEQLSA